MSSLGALLDQLVSRVSALEAKLGGGAVAVSATPAASSPAAAAAADDEPSAQTLEFDGLVDKYGKTIAAACATLGGDATAVGEAVLKLYQFNRKVIDMASKCKKPSDAVKGELVKELQAIAAPLGALKSKRDCTHPNHAVTASEAVAGFMWVLQDMGPLGVIEAGRDGAEFYANKVRKESKDKSQPESMTFANNLRDGFNAVYAFVKEHFKTGLAWNPKGGDAAAYKGAGGAAPAAAAPAPAAAAPAPAPAPAAAAAPAAAPKAPAGGDAQVNLFAELRNIDQSSGKTAGLRHVTKEMKSGGGAGAAAPAPAPTPSAAAANKVSRADGAFPTGEASIKLTGQRWAVSFQQGVKEPIHITECDMKQEIYIYGCKDAIIFVDKKCKGVRVDTCRNLTLVLDSVLSGIEIVDCKRMKVQCNKSLPSVAIDKTDGILVGLTWACREAQIVSSKSSEMNVTFPVSEAEDADWVEQPIPEQFISVISKDNKLVSRVSDLYSA